MESAFSLSLSPAVRCPAIRAPQHGHISCDGDPTTPNSYPNQCRFTCEDGFRMSGVSAISCTASEHWTEQPPLCEGKRKSPIGNTYIYTM